MNARHAGRGGIGKRSSCRVETQVAEAFVVVPGADLVGTRQPIIVFSGGRIAFGLTDRILQLRDEKRAVMQVEARPVPVGRIVAQRIADRAEMKARMAEEVARGNQQFSHFGPKANLFQELADPRGIDFPYLLSMLDGSFMSRANTIVCPGGKMDLAMQLVFTPMIWRLIERRKQASAD